MGKSPVVYTDKVIREIGLKEPPFCERTIAAHLGLQVYEFTGATISAFQEQNPDAGEIFEHLQTACAWLHKEEDGSGVICTNADMPNDRKRMSVFHECGHAVMPWHDGVDYVCGNDGLDSTTINLIEREAFSFGSSFLMPPAYFTEDVMSLDTSLCSVRRLADRYVSSLEATAIWYAYTHPGHCGFMMVESATTTSYPAPYSNPDQFVLSLTGVKRTVPPASRYPLRVKYFVASNRLPLFVRAGTGIAEGTPIHRVWVNDRRGHGEVPASALGSSATHSFMVDCSPHGRADRMMVLFWVPDRQVGLKFRRGESV